VRALVTGGAGFIGSHLAERLVASGHVVDVIDDLSGGSLSNLASARADAATSGGELKIHTLDVRAPELVDIASRRHTEIIFHLAARHSDDRAATEVALLGALNVLEAARAAGVTKVVVALDAGALYGAVPTSELPVKEGRTEPSVTVAGATQTAIVALLDAYRSQHAVEFTSLALVDVYGPRSTRGVVAEFVSTAVAGRPCAVHGDGRQTRDLLFVDDAVDAFIRAATRGSGLVVNIGTGVQTSIRDLERLVAGPDGPSPLKAPARPDERGRFAVSPVRARIHLAWAPWTTLADGIEATKSQTSTR
jgi:UDP-glucose 4-epimerase